MTGKKIRIAYLITDLDVGGAEKNLTALATGLDRERFDVSVASLLPPGDLGDVLREAGVPVTDIHMSGHADVRAPGRVVRWLRRTRPHLLHTWLFHANLLGRCAAALAGVRAVVSSTRVAEPRRWHSALERLTSPLVACFLVNSASLREYAIGGGIDPQRIKVIPNYVDLERFAVRRPAERPGVKTALFIGRLAGQKAVDVLLRAAALLSGRRDLRFDLVGDGPDRAELTALAGGLGLTNVHFRGRSSRIPALLAEADVFVLPSRWEGLPNVVLEAMAARCPVVGTDVTGTRDLIRDGENGLLVPPEDPAALGAAIERLVDNAALRRSLAEMGFLTASRHTLAAMIHAHETLYLNVLKRDSIPR